MAEPGKIVGAVRVDDSDRLRQFLIGLMMVDHHHVEAELLGFVKRLLAGGAAVDRDQQARPLVGKRPDGVDVWTVTFEDSVRDMDDRIEAALAQIVREQRRRCRPVDVVVAENRDRLAVLRGVGQTRCRRLHVGELVRIGHQPPDGRIEKSLDVSRRLRHGLQAPWQEVQAARGAARW